MRFSCWLVVPVLAYSPLCAQTLSKSAIREQTAAVAGILDDWHQNAAQSDEERYFGHMAPDAVFMGTDEKDRWTRNAFRKWAHPQFEARAGWVFKPSQRNVTLSGDGRVAWFDELIDMSGGGMARGSGVLVKEGQVWLIAQYHLSLLIPRLAFGEVRQVIEAQKLTTTTMEDDKKAEDAKKAGSDK